MPYSYKLLTCVAVHSSYVSGEIVAKQHMYPPSNLLELSHFLYIMQANRADKGFSKEDYHSRGSHGVVSSRVRSLQACGTCACNAHNLPAAR